MITPIQTKNLFANYKASLQDLQALEIFTTDQTASLLCIGKDGHLWTQNRNVDIFTQFFDWIYRSLFEKSFDSEQDKVNCLMDRVHWNLAFVEQIGIFAGLNEEDIKAIRLFNKTVIPFARNKFINLTRRQHKFLCLERATIAEWQGASEDQKFAAKPTQLNMNLFLANGINADSLQNDNLSQQFQLALRVTQTAWKVLNAKEAPEDLAPREVLLRLEQTADFDGDDFREVEEPGPFKIVPETFLKESPPLKLDIDDLVKQAELFLSEEDAQKFREVVNTVTNHYLSARENQVAKKKFSIDFFRKLDAKLNQKIEKNPNDPNLKKRMIYFCIFAEEELRRLRGCSRNESARADEMKELHDLEMHFRIASQVLEFGLILAHRGERDQIGWN